MTLCCGALCVCSYECSGHEAKAREKKEELEAKANQLQTSLEQFEGIYMIYSTTPCSSSLTMCNILYTHAAFPCSPPPPPKPVLGLWSFVEDNFHVSVINS